MNRTLTQGEVMRRTTPNRLLVLFAIAVAAAATAFTAAAASARPWLGVYTQEVTGDLREGLDLRDNDAGVLVNRVVEDGPADRAGLRKGDLIVKLNARTVESPATLARMVGDAREGQTVELQILRGGERRTLNVTLSARPSDDEGDRMAPAPPEPPTPPSAPAPPADEDRGDRGRRDVRIRIVTPDDDHGAPKVYRYDGDMEHLPDDMRKMVDDLHAQGLDGKGSLRLRAMAQALGARARLGVRIEPLSDDLAEALGAPGREGVLVVEVMPDTPASRAGLRAGDVILAANDRNVTSAEDLQKALREVDGKVSLTVARKGERRTVEADLGSPSRSGRDDDSPGPGRLEGLDRGLRLRDRDDAGAEDLRQQMDELRQQLRELRRQLEEQRKDH